MLLAGLEGQAIGGAALGVTGHPDQPAGQVPLVRLAGGEEGGVGAAEAHGNAEALGRAHRHVRPELARGPEQGQGEEIGGHHEQGPGGVRPLGEIGRVPDDAVGGRVLHEHAEQPLSLEVRGLRPADVDLDAQGLGPGAHHRDRLRVAVLGHEEALRDPARPPREQSVMASAAAVASSRSEALARGSPVRSDTMVWKLSSASRRPWAISAW